MALTGAPANTASTASRSQPQPERTAVGGSGYRRRFARIRI